MPKEALVSDLTARRARLDGATVALICGDQRIDYAALETSVCGAANVLVDLGVSHGDRVALLMRNSLDYVVLYYAIARIGAILCPLNWRLAPPEIGVILSHAEPRIVLYDAEFISLIDSWPKGKENSGRFIEHTEFTLRCSTASAISPISRVTADDPLLLVYTSGTAGRSKGVVFTHRQILWVSMTMAATLDYQRGDINMIATPLFHVGGLSFAILSVHLGATSLLLSTWNPSIVLEQIGREQVNHFFAVAAMLESLVADSLFDLVNLNDLRWVMAGGAPVPLTLIHIFAGRGIPLVQTYGSTETGGPATVVDMDHSLEKAGSAGLPFFHTDVRIADRAGEGVGANETGEVQVRAPHIGAYWREPSAMQAAFVGAWFRMGDIGYLDEDGYLFLLGRKTDLIVTGGENVYPSEIETILNELAQVSEVAVIGVTDRRWGEVVCAVVVPATGRTISLDEISRYCEGRIARYKTPRNLVLRCEPLPRNATGKVLRQVLKDEAQVSEKVNVPDC